MTFITSLTASHFRSHKQAKFELDKRPVAISGPNGSGKTNILEAVSLFSPGRGLRGASAESMMRKPDCLGWKIIGHVMSDDRLMEIVFSSIKGAAREVTINGKSATQIALAQHSRVLWLVPSMDRLWVEGAEGRRRFLDRISLSFFPTHAENTLRYEKSMRERNRLLKDQVRDPYWYKALERQMAEAGVAINSARKKALEFILSSQQGATTEFPVAELELQQTEGSLPETAEDLYDAFEESRSCDLVAGRTMVGPHKTDVYGAYATKGVPAPQCSTGEQKALLISIVLANARALARDHGKAPLLLLDEISAHLDKDRRTALYEEICALGLQAWMTGTERDLFEEFGDRAQYIQVDLMDNISRSSLTN